MAIKPDSLFTGKIAAASTDYPLGSARNVTTPGDGTGTPFLADLVNDIFGFQQALLAEAGITPSESPDTAVASQYLGSLRALLAPFIASTTALISGTSDSLPVGTVMTTGGYTSPGDGYGARWVKTATTGVISQSPTQLQNALLNDAGGSQWALVSALTVAALGAFKNSSTDSTLAINAAINAIRLSDVSPVLGILGSMPKILDFEGGVYTCNSPINATALTKHGWEIKGSGAVIISKATNKTGFDLTTSRWGTISQLTVTAENADNVLQGIQYGRDVTGNTANSLVFDNVTVTGYYTRTAVYNYASEVDTHIAPSYINYNDDSDSYALILDGQHVWGIVSDFVTAASLNTPESNIQHTFLGGGSRKLISGPTVWLSQVKQLRMVNHYITCIDDYAVVLADSGASFTDLHFDAHFEADGMESCFKFDRTASGASVTKTVIPSFYFKDHGPQSAKRIFWAEGDLNVKLMGEIDIAFWQEEPALGVCQPRPQFELVGNIKLPTLEFNNSLNTSGTLMPYNGVLSGTVGGTPEIISTESGKERIFKGKVIFTSKVSDNITVANILSLQNVIHEDGATKMTPLDALPTLGANAGVIAIDDGTDWSGVNSTGANRLVFHDGAAWKLINLT